MYFLNFTSPNVNERCMAGLVSLATNKIAFLLGFYFFPQAGKCRSWKVGMEILALSVWNSFSASAGDVVIQNLFGSIRTYKFCPFYFFSFFFFFLSLGQIKPKIHFSVLPWQVLLGGTICVCRDKLFTTWASTEAVNLWQRGALNHLFIFIFFKVSEPKLANLSKKRTALTKKFLCWPGNNIIQYRHSCRRFSHCSPDSSRPSAIPCVQDLFLRNWRGDFFFFFHSVFQEMAFPSNSK